MTKGTPIFKECTFTCALSNGVLCDGSSPIFNNCSITKNKYPGVVVSNDGNPIFLNSSITNGKNAGLLVYDNGKGIFSGCNFSCILNHFISF